MQLPRETHFDDVCVIGDLRPRLPLTRGKRERSVGSLTQLKESESGIEA